MYIQFKTVRVLCTHKRMYICVMYIKIMISDTSDLDTLHI